jgi:acyl dehydratase
MMAEPKVVEGADGLRALIGEQLGYTDWLPVAQDQVDRFADATGDHQWIHVDQERAKAGPFGQTVAHGLLTL